MSADELELVTPADLENGSKDKVDGNILETSDSSKKTSSLTGSDPISPKRRSLFGRTSITLEEKEAIKKEKAAKKAEKKRLKENLKLDAEQDEFQKKLGVRLWMIFIWIGAGAIMIWFLVGIVTQYITALANPTSTIQIQDDPSLPLPSVTICNWNQVPVGTNSSDCPECDLQLVGCTDLSNNTDCTGLWQKRDWLTKYGLFHCYEFNNDLNNIQWSNGTGYAGSFSTLWSMKILPTADPPINRAAVQATFAVQNTTTADTIWGEITFAATGMDTFIGLLYINEVHNEAPTSNTSRYQKTSSNVRLLTARTVNNTNIDYVAVSFAFQTLSTQIITFDIGYSILNFFGDFAGMIGTLMGLDTIKVAMGIPTAFFSWKQRSTLPMEDLFNG